MYLVSDLNEEGLQENTTTCTCERKCKGSFLYFISGIKQWNDMYCSVNIFHDCRTIGGSQSGDVYCTTGGERDCCRFFPPGPVRGTTIGDEDEDDDEVEDEVADVP